MSTVDTKPEISFLCGKIKPESERLLRLGIIQLWDGKEIRVSPDDKGLAYVLPGKRRMIIAKNGHIVAIYARPRIVLLRMLELGADPTIDSLTLKFSPIFPKPPHFEPILQPTWGKKASRSRKHAKEISEMVRPIVNRFYSDPIN